MSMIDPLSSISPANLLSERFISDVLADLVRIPSTNPGTYENAMANRIMGWFAGTQVEAKQVESMPGRYSVGAVLRGKLDGPQLIFNGHMDTVPIDDEGLWTVDPFAATMKDGYLYGRGACDMKAGLAVQIAVAHHLAAQTECMRGSLVLHFAAGEERAEPGTLSLLKAGFTGDIGIVTEPTELRIAVATRGLAPLQVRLRGKSIHASRAQYSTNPAWALSWILQALESYRLEIEARRHPLLSHGSCTPTVVQGGVTPNAVSDFVDIYIDRRLIPGESVDRELNDVKNRLLAARPRDSKIEIDVSAAYNRFEPAEISRDEPVVNMLIGSVAKVTGKPGEVYGAPYASDMRNLVNDAGIPAVNFGPGNVSECHCANERVATRQLETCAHVIADVAKTILMQDQEDGG